MSALARAARDLLNTNALRRLANPLRASNPALYSRMNGVRKKLLCGRSGVDAYQANALRAFGEVAKIPGARVLEIGSDPGLSVLHALVEAGAREAVGVNNAPEIWRAHPAGAIEQGRSRLIEADARRLPFEDASFDHVFSVATFEHLIDLPEALGEMHRVLAPGGRLYANFGPIWSAGKGHHLRVEVDGAELRHFVPEKNPLPDFVHLLLSPDELRDALAGRVEEKLIEPTVHWVYRDHGINRLFHHEYLRIFDESSLSLLRTRAERDPIDPQLLRLLALRHPAESSFETTNLEAVLAKAPS